MKFVYICISFLAIHTLLYAEKNPFKLSNIDIIEANTQELLSQFDTIKKKQEAIKRQRLFEERVLKEAKLKQALLEARILAEKKKIQKEEEKSRREALKKEHNQKTIYLTFDDGPLLGTNNVLKVLKEESVEATMFFVGDHIKKNKKLFKKALNMPNLCISNHTFSHANEKYRHFYSNLNRVVSDIDKSQQIIGGEKFLRLAGRNVWRLPNICKNDYAICKKQRKIEIPKYDVLVNNGYKIYGWDIEWGFNRRTGNPIYGVDTIVKMIEKKYVTGKMTKKGKMVLLAHDYMFKGEKGISVLREFIQKLKEKDWKFETLKGYNTTLN